ncbi:hypothetical protein HFP67_28165 [Bacillus sp. CB102A.1]
MPSAAKELVRAKTILLRKVMNLAGEHCHIRCSRFIRREIRLKRCTTYGPSEDTTYSTYMELEKGVMHRVPPIGKPIFNTEVYVLSAEQKWFQLVSL